MRKGTLRDILRALLYNNTEVRTMRDIGKNIKQLRVQKNMTQDELAEKLFVTRQTVSNYETGRSRPDVEMLAKIAEVLDTDANTVIYGIPNENGRKKEYIAAVFGGAVILLLTLPLPWLNSITDRIGGFRFILWPRYLLVMYYIPFILLCIGWEAMQILSLFTKLTPIPKTKWLLRGCLMFIAFYVLMNLLLILPIDKPMWLMYVLYFLLGAHPQIFSINFAYLLLPVGCLLWLCGFPRK